MELISSTINLNLMKHRFLFFGVSLALIVFCVFVWFQRGADKYSVDFLGGTDVVVKFDNQVTIAQIRQALEKADIKGAVVQAFEGGSRDFSIRLKTQDSANAATTVDTGKKIREVLASIEGSKFELLKEDFVGPIIGEQIRKDGLKSIVIALICILAYITFRFEWRFAVGAIAALVHDVLITTGLFVFSGKEISAAVLAAILTIIGYSLNDTIIVFDRIRENYALALKAGSGKGKKKQNSLANMSFVELVNHSVNQTLSRTVLTSLTTLFVVTSLWILGGGAVADLSFALVIGVIVGTYSSIFIACTVVLLLDQFATKQVAQQQNAAQSV